VIRVRYLILIFLIIPLWVEAKTFDLVYTKFGSDSFKIRDSIEVGSWTTLDSNQSRRLTQVVIRVEDIPSSYTLEILKGSKINSSILSSCPILFNKLTYELPVSSFYKDPASFPLNYNSYQYIQGVIGDKNE
jgi:hypothetical protein